MTSSPQQAAGNKQQAQPRTVALVTQKAGPALRFGSYAPKLVAGCLLLAACSLFAASPDQFNGAAAMDYVREVVRFGPRWVGSPGHTRTENWLRVHLRADALEEDGFTASTPAGPK